MKALSLGLVKGSIDQLNQEVNMTWVQPRVLDIDQVCDEEMVYSSNKSRGLLLWLKINGYKIQSSVIHIKIYPS